MGDLCVDERITLILSDPKRTTVRVWAEKEEKWGIRGRRRRRKKKKR
jgi:hypothetical protein